MHCSRCNQYSTPFFSTPMPSILCDGSALQLRSERLMYDELVIIWSRQRSLQSGLELFKARSLRQLGSVVAVINDRHYSVVFDPHESMPTEAGSSAQ